MNSFLVDIICIIFCVFSKLIQLSKSSPKLNNLIDLLFDNTNPNIPTMMRIPISLPGFVLVHKQINIM